MPARAAAFLASCSDPASKMWKQVSSCGAIRYTRTTDGLNIAYQVVGEGPLDLVFVPQVISNVEIFWENPRWAAFMRELASFSRLLLFDRRGVGLSDRPSGVPPLEQ